MRRKRWTVLAAALAVLPAARFAGAIHMETDRIEAWRGGRGKYPREKRIVLYGSGIREAVSARVALRLKALGFEKIYALEGGWREWSAAGLPTERR